MTDQIATVGRRPTQNSFPRLSWERVEFHLAPVGQNLDLLNNNDRMSFIYCVFISPVKLTGQVCSSGVPSAWKIEWMSDRSLPTGPESNSG